jgi:alanine dehydrogenase
MSAMQTLSREQVERLLTPAACMEAVEDAFRQLALGRAPPPGILATHAEQGSFHVKAGLLATSRPFFAAKVNANFPGNARGGDMPTIQGLVLLFDAGNGSPLAIMDSIAITALRTAAAAAIAAKHLALDDVEEATICGCGGQAAAQLRALLAVRRVRRIHVNDLDTARAARFADAMARELQVEVKPSPVAAAVATSRIVITCTTATRYFITREMVAPGTFIAAVGADNEHKQEIDPKLMAAATVVTDLTAQAATIGDLHHAIDAGVMRAEDVRAELAEIIVGAKPGRTSRDEIVIFDSTGTGLQDVAAAIATWRRAQEDPS